MTINTKKYIEEFIKIKTKDGNVVSFILNEPQLKMYNIIKKQALEEKPIRIIVLKARQMGFSTLTEAIIFKNTATKKNISSGIITHIDKATNNLFNMSKLMYDKLPKPLKPNLKASNAKELVFNNDTGTGLNSRIECMTAGSSGVGRSNTIQYLHVSEYAFWKGNKEETLSGLLQTVPDTPNSMVVIESTANGFDDFRKLWYMAINGESDYYPLFVGWNELNTYRRKYDGFELTEYEKEIKVKFNLDDEQLSWRRWCIKNNCSGNEKTFRQEYPLTPEEAFISTGDTIFDIEKISDRLQRIPKPIREGHFEYDKVNSIMTNIKWVDKKDDIIKVYEEPKNDMFVIGGDTAGEGSDNFTAHVISEDGTQVAVLKHKFDEDLYANQVFCLGIYYNKALIAPEVNFSTYPIRELEKMQYPNLYLREKMDSITNKRVFAHGFKTTTLTRPIIIAELVKIVREDIDKINDRATLEEMLTFKRNEAGKPEAEQGYHDDLIMALAIAYFIRPKEIMKNDRWEDNLSNSFKGNVRKGSVVI